MSSGSDSEEDFETHVHMFRSSLDVGSHFIDFSPETELVFRIDKGSLVSTLKLTNVTEKAHIAYFVFTSAPYRIIITPKCGFLDPHSQIEVTLRWTEGADPEKLNHVMFFVKALPLSNDMDIKEMEVFSEEVFNDYNVNILFNIAALPSRVLTPIGAPVLMP